MTRWFNVGSGLVAATLIPLFVMVCFLSLNAWGFGQVPYFYYERALSVAALFLFLGIACFFIGTIRENK